MTRIAFSFLLSSLLMNGVLSTSPARAQDALTGTWKLVNSSTETAQRLAAIEASTQDLPSFMRSRIKERLGEKTTPPSELRIRAKGDEVELSGQGRTLRLTVGGAAVPLEMEGRRASAQATRKNGNLVVTLQGDGGVRTNTYRLSKDGQGLVLDVEFNAQRLSTPVRYQSTYKRR